MAKIKSLYQCSNCGGESPKWQGQCPHCGEWNTLTEVTVEKNNTNSRFKSWASDDSGIQLLSEVDSKDVERIPIGMSELDQVLGGGLVLGGV
ncbi:MAG: DNA repair protein RadA, partial [Neisseriaceae bacterium]|nr:DNA repair protein RadA [Neisseriaceae bacterium]